MTEKSDGQRRVQVRVTEYLSYDDLPRPGVPEPVPMEKDVPPIVRHVVNRLCLLMAWVVTLSIALVAFGADGAEVKIVLVAVWLPMVGLVSVLLARAMAEKRD